MHTTTLGYILRKARKTKKLLQREVAAGCDTLTQVRVSCLERDRDQPLESELAHLAERLDLDLDYLGRLVLARQTATAPSARALFGQRPRFVHPRSRPSSVRLSALKKDCWDICQAVWRRLERRSDWVAVDDYLHRMVTDSKVESLGSMRLLDGGLNPHRLSPLRAGFRQWPIVNPETRQVVGDLVTPALYGVVAGRTVVVFPQQSMLVRDGSLVQPDLLIGVRTEVGMVWCAGEYDGNFKGTVLADARSASLEMPVVRFTEDAVYREDFADNFWTAVFTAVDLGLRAA